GLQRPSRSLRRLRLPQSSRTRARTSHRLSFFRISLPTPLFGAPDGGGQQYRVTTALEDPVSGISVAIFDSNSVFVPGHYGVGFIQDVPAAAGGLRRRF